MDARSYTAEVNAFTQNPWKPFGMTPGEYREKIRNQPGRQSGVGGGGSLRL